MEFTTNMLSEGMSWMKAVGSGLGAAAKDMKPEGGLLGGRGGRALGGAGHIASKIGAAASGAAGAIGGAGSGRGLKYAALGAGAIGFSAARPFHGGYEKIVNQGLLGYPHATRIMGNAAISGGIQQAAGISSYKALSHSPGQSMGSASSTQGPSGDIVFGLYNLRA